MNDDSDAMDEILREFLVESYESLDSLDSELIVLEEDPHSQAVLSQVFRTIHSIKGTSGVLGFGRLEKVAHVGENLLSRMRDGEMTFDQAIATGLLQMVDAVREIMRNIEQDGTDGENDYGALILLLEDLLEGETLDTTSAQAKQAETPDTSKASLETSPEDVQSESAKASDVDSQTYAEATDEACVEDEAFEAAALEELFAQEAAAVASTPSAPAKEASETKAASLSDSTVRVDVGLLDQVMNQVGELVLARNRIMQFSAQSTDNELLKTVQSLNLITSELQEGVMKTRMQPIGSIWNKFPRAVRDLCVSCKKKVNLIMEGRETELDRTLIEAIKDPLTHAIRNSVDHGIESPEERLHKGKSFTGTVRLRAYHEGGQVSIELWDDGKGIDPVVIGKKAVEKGIVTPDEVRRMSERELIQLVFAPGFSTAAAVTNVSGRGVGMDVVRTNIEKIGGTVELRSEVGRWTELKIKIPLTLAIIPALVVRQQGGRFAIPQASLVELLRIAPGQSEARIESLNGARVFRLRGKLLPLVHLGEVLGLKNCEWPGDTVTEVDRSWNIVVLHTDDQVFGVVVDGISDTEEIVVKPLGKQLKNISVFAGATIMGDGNVALILDVAGLTKESGVLKPNGEQARSQGDADQVVRGHTGESVILVEVGHDGRMAMPLSSVSRLEEFELSQVERCGDREVIQYRGRIMPLVRLSHFFGRASQVADDSCLQVVVNGEGENSVGIVVDRIIDITRAEVEEGDHSDMAVIDGKVTQIINTESILSSVGH